MARRSNGEGTVFQRKDNGRWTWELMTGYAPDGKKEIRRGNAATQAAAIRARDQARRQHQLGALGPKDREKETVRAYLLAWLAGKEGTIRPSTLKRYHDLLLQHVVPALGRLRLAAVTPEQVRLLYASLRQKEVVRAGYRDTPRRLSESTVHHVHVALKMAFKQAVDDGRCPKNPCLGVRMPRVPVARTTTPTIAEIQRLLEADGPFRTLWILAAHSGCRVGELLGLQWADVDFARDTITVRRTLLGSSAGVPRFGPPKTEQSVRTIFLPAGAIQALRRHRQEQPPDEAGYGLCFATAVGRPLLYSNVVRAFKRALAGAGLPATVRLHDCRHFAATAMMQGQVPLKVVSRRLGHAHIGITAQLYQHPDEEDDRAAAGVLGRLLETGIETGTTGIPAGPDGGNRDKTRTPPGGRRTGEGGTGQDHAN